MFKFKNEAIAYLKKQNYTYPVNSHALNKELNYIMAVAFTADFLLAILIGKLTGWIWNKIGEVPYLTQIELNNYVSVGAGCIILFFAIGYFYIYKPKWSYLMEESECISFLKRGFTFIYIFSRLIFIWTLGFYILKG